MLAMSLLGRKSVFLSRFCKLAKPISTASTFKFSDLKVELCCEDQKQSKPNPDELVFGTVFSDHMLEIDWSAGNGWAQPRICPLHNLNLHPAAKVFHYAVELYEGLKAYRGVDGKIRIFRPALNMARCNMTAQRASLPLFEGMKAYRGDDGKIRLFRPDRNMERMRNSARRSAFPTFDGEELISCMKKLINIDQEWVPYSTTSTLYIRPTMIGTDPSLGVTVSQTAKLFVITGPVGPYYPTGFKPVSLLADPAHVRSWKGGVGGFKMGSNYAPTIYIQNEALQKHNCQQVLWLYGPDHQCTEVGAMNLFMFWINEQGGIEKKELITPPLSNGIILPGVTRRSLMELAKSWGEFKVTEKTFTMKDITKALDEERVYEMFGAGTACVVCPIEKIVYDGIPLSIPTMEKGAPITMRLYKELTDIQFGRTPSDWAVLVD